MTMASNGLGQPGAGDVVGTTSLCIWIWNRIFLFLLGMAWSSRRTSGAKYSRAASVHLKMRLNGWYFEIGDGDDGRDEGGGRETI